VAKKTIVQLIDDIDGSKADTTVRFAWQGTSYEIDLSNKNARAFESAIQPYLAQATRGAAGRGPRRGSARKSKPELSEIRAWAAKNGHSLATRGRIPSAIIDAYRAASGGSAAATTRAPAKKATKRTARKSSAKAAARKTSARKAPGRKATPARKAAPRRARRA
jgi:hypothetical protein